jgi:sugar/nucleoside kinase (ribokinase family)
LLGGDAAFDALLTAAHDRGLRVIVDLVVNHVGVGFLPFTDVIDYGERSPWRDWFVIDSFPVRPWSGKPTYRCWNDNPSMPVLNHHNPVVRRHVVEAAVHWARRGVDGLRLDAASEVVAPVLFDELREAVARVSPEIYLLGETWTDPSWALDGRRWHGATGYPFHFAVRELAGGRHLQPAHAHPDSIRAGGIDAREYARRVDSIFGGKPAWQLEHQVNFVDGHDVARLITLAGGDRASVELADLLTFTAPGATSVYYGAEVGLTGGMPPDCRRGFPPPAQWDQAALARTRALIALRHACPALRRGGYRTVAAEGHAYAALRSDGAQEVVVAVNAGEAPALLRLDPGHVHPRQPAVLHGAAELHVEGGALTLRLAPRSGVVVDLAGARLEAGAPAVAATAKAVGPEVVVVGNIGIDTNVYLPRDFSMSRLESAFTDDVDVIGQAGGYSSFGFTALGRRTGFIGSVGDDALGHWIRGELADAEIAAELFVDPAGTARSVNLMATDGTRKNFYDGKSHMQLAPQLGPCRDLLRGARLVHVHLPNWARQVLPVARELGLTISCDLQDMTQVDDPYRADFIAAADVLFCSAVNLEPRDLALALRARNPRATVVVGMGARGAGLCDADGFRHFPPVSMKEPVIDSNGAGDSLAVGFLTARVLLGLPAERAVRWGQLAARWACTLRVKWRRLATREQLEALEARGG